MISGFELVVSEACCVIKYNNIHNAIVPKARTMPVFTRQWTMRVGSADDARSPTWLHPSIVPWMPARTEATVGRGLTATQLSYIQIDSHNRHKNVRVIYSITKLDYIVLCEVITLAYCKSIVWVIAKGKISQLRGRQFKFL